MSIAQAIKQFPALKLPKRKRSPVPRPPSTAEELFALYCRHELLPPFEREYPFGVAIGRKWRFDFAWPHVKVAVEIEGLRKVFDGEGRCYAVGRHTTFEGFADDCIKYAHANTLGWHVNRFNQALVRDGTAILLTRQLLIAREVGIVGDTAGPVVAPTVMTAAQMRKWIGP